MPDSRRGRAELVAAAAVACTLLIALAGGAAEPRRPNILILLAEDMGPRVGAFGDAVAVTPHIERLPRERAARIRAW
jgi:hypothetical protein